MVQRRRNEAQDLPVAPRTRGEIQIPEEYRHLEDGRNFLLADLGDGDDRILIFGTQGNLERLATCARAYSDGTFDTVPPLFTQLYSVHGLIHHFVRPLVYGLLPRKDRPTYLRFFTYPTSLPSLPHS